MLIYYASLSGNVRRFLERLPDSFDIRDIQKHERATAPFIFVTYTFGFGQVPDAVSKWLQLNNDKLLAVAASGNRVWGDNYAKAGDLIAHEYNVPMLYKFELSGTPQDTKEFTRKAVTLHDNLFTAQQRANDS